MHPPRLGLQPFCWRRTGEIPIQINVPQHVPVRSSGCGLVQIPRFHKTRQSLSTLDIVRRIVQLNRAGDVDLVEPDSGFVQSANRFCDVFKLDRLVANVIADSQVVTGDIPHPSPFSLLEQLLKERQCLVGCLQQTQRLRFDRQPNPAAGLFEPPPSRGSPAQQGVDGLRIKVLGPPKMFEA